MAYGELMLSDSEWIESVRCKGRKRERIRVLEQERFEWGQHRWALNFVGVVGLFVLLVGLLT